MRWSFAQLLPILIVSHVVVTFIFFNFFSNPQQAVLQRVPSQPFSVAEAFFAENTPISADSAPVEENEDKKIIYAVCARESCVENAYELQNNGVSCSCTQSRVPPVPAAISRLCGRTGSQSSTKL